MPEGKAKIRTNLKQIISSSMCADAWKKCSREKAAKKKGRGEEKSKAEKDQGGSLKKGGEQGSLKIGEPKPRLVSMPGGM